MRGDATCMHGMPPLGECSWPGAASSWSWGCAPAMRRCANSCGRTREEGGYDCLRYSDPAGECLGPQHTAIYTDVTLAVERVLTGPSGEVVTLQVAGGMVGGMGMRTSNDATFREGERVIVFLDTSAVPSTMVGMQQGKFVVKDNMVTGPSDLEPGRVHRGGPRCGALETCERGACEREILCCDARMCGMVRRATPASQVLAFVRNGSNWPICPIPWGRTGLFVLTACLASRPAHERWCCCMELRAFPVHL